MRTGFILISAVFAACFFAERRWPLRQWTQPRLSRLLTNLSLGILSAGLVRLLFYSSVLETAALTSSRNWGLLGFFPLNSRVGGLVSFLLLDYTLYLWHWMNHNVPFLWRFHNVHHVDLDLDVGTSARFHVGELSLATGFRLLQIVVIGVDPLTLLIFDAVVWPATPRMHGIHHSIVQGETNSNFSTVFSFWDRLHSTLRLNVPQAALSIGVPSYRRPDETTFLQSLLLPFRRQRPWRLPDGTIPHR